MYTRTNINYPFSNGVSEVLVKGSEVLVKGSEG